MSKMSIEEAIQFIDPEYREVVRGMADNMPNNTKLSVMDVLNYYIPQDGMRREERLALLLLTSVDKNKFAPKMTNSQRCEVLALHHKGFRREVLAKMYKVDRRTITHIYTPHSPHYKNIRNERTGIGPEEFDNKYLTDDIVNTALSFSYEIRKAEGTNNQFANAKRGIHVIQGRNCTYAHRVTISWREANGDISVSGWYYQDLDGDFPDTWFSVDEESMKTSMACYSAMLGDITDKLE